MSNDTVPGAYALAKSGSDYTLAGVTLSQSGSVYSSGSGDTNGMKLNIADTNITSANIYFGETILLIKDNNLPCNLPDIILGFNIKTFEHSALYVVFNCCFWFKINSLTI